MVCTVGVSASVFMSGYVGNIVMFSAGEEADRLQLSWRRVGGV